MFSTQFTNAKSSNYVQCPEGTHLASVVSVEEGVQSSDRGRFKQFAGSPVWKLKLSVEHPNGTASSLFADLTMNEAPETRRVWEPFFKSFHYWGDTHPAAGQQISVSPQGCVGLRGHVTVKHNPKKDGSGVYVNVVGFPENKGYVPRKVDVVPSIDDDTI